MKNIRPEDSERNESRENTPYNFSHATDFDENLWILCGVLEGEVTAQVAHVSFKNVSKTFYKHL